MEIQLINGELFKELHDKAMVNERLRQIFDLRTTAADETCFVEIACFRVCPREGQYGLQVPLGKWHTIEVHEPSTIFKAKDGKYGE